MTDMHLPAGEELRLRTTRREDLAFVRAAEGAEEARDWVEQWDEAAHADCLDDPDAAHFTVEEAATGLPVGFLILQGLERGGPEGGILLRRLVMTRRGEGFGAQVLDAAMRHCFDDLDGQRLWLEVKAGHAAARGLYERAGFALEREPNGWARYALTRADWPATPAGQRAGEEKAHTEKVRVVRAESDLHRKSTQDPADFE